MNDPVNKIKEAAKKIKVRLDNRTTITLASIGSLELWKERYPNLKIITKQQTK
ncbi:MAG: hypothetical protein ACJASM_001756 [Salibacteraceae bacterium]|mgnify:CR=1 FL=1|jgi:hypothetical protein